MARDADIRRRLSLALAVTSALATLVAALSLLTHAAESAPQPGEVLPDLRQEVPSRIGTQVAGGQAFIGFESRTTNVAESTGAGYLHIQGRRSGIDQELMVATQILHRTRTSFREDPEPVGNLKYVAFGSHDHWHFLDFQRFTLHSASDAAATPIPDVKQGFCLVATDLEGPRQNPSCGRDNNLLTAIEIGIDPGRQDVYSPFVEGQQIPISRQTAPSGEYVLVHEANPGRRIMERSFDNNTAAVRIRLQWPTTSTGAPTVTVLQQCPLSNWCGARPGDPTPPPPPPPPPPPTALRPDAVDLISGTYYSGRSALSRLFSDDSSRLEVTAAATGSTRTAEIRPRTTVPTPATVSRLQLEYDGSSSWPGTAVTMSVFNLVSQTWQVIDGPRSVSTSDRKITWVAPTPGDYIGPDGRVAMRVRATNSRSFRLRADLARFTVTR